MVVFPFTLEGERDWLVQTAQEHGPADDVQREDCPWEAEERSVQPSHDLCAADAQQGDGTGFNSQDGVRLLHLTQQVSEAAHFVFLITLKLNSHISQFGCSH